MVAGKDAETARIDRQALGKSIFRREIGDELAVDRRRGLAHPAVIGLAGGAVVREVARIVAGSLEGGLGHPPQHEYRIVTAIPPKRRVEAPEKCSNHRLPTPEEVIRQFGQTGDGVGKGRTNEKFTDRLNVKWH